MFLPLLFAFYLQRLAPTFLNKPNPFSAPPVTRNLISTLILFRPPRPLHFGLQAPAAFSRPRFPLILSIKYPEFD